jgi:hypothetical protein
VKASEVRVGDRVRARGFEVLVSRIDTGFLGRDRLALVEDTDARWFKVSVAPDDDVELVARPD